MRWVLVVTCRRGAPPLAPVKADEALTDEEIAEELEVGRANVERVRRRSVEEGLERRSAERSRAARHIRRSSTVRAKRAWCSWPAAPRLRAASAGRSICYRTSWSWPRSSCPSSVGSVSISVSALQSTCARSLPPESAGEAARLFDGASRRRTHGSSSDGCIPASWDDLQAERHPNLVATRR